MYCAKRLVQNGKLPYTRRVRTTIEIKMSEAIHKVGVIGAGTMGAGIAGLCAATGVDVILLDLQTETAQKAIDRLTSGKRPAITEDQAKLITAGSLESDLKSLEGCDWICEAVVEDLKIKRDLFAKLEPIRKDGSILTTNTSGIPLNEIYTDMPERMQKDIAVTHFFNPVHLMRLVELVPGSKTDPAVISRLAEFMSGPLGKGVVYAKDTVNFIGNRIGCNWMLSGLHKAASSGLSMETADALMSKPVGLPPTGLYGLIDLIGLDVMDFVAKNLEKNLPANDAGREFLTMPPAELTMLKNGQLGRKTGGGFYKLIKSDTGEKSMEVFDLSSQSWRPMSPASLDTTHQNIKTLMFSNDAEGKFAWDLMASTLSYSSSLVPEISNDIVNVDRAMRWGFAWAQGPFEMLDAIGPKQFAEKYEANGRAVDGMLKVLLDSGKDTFYAGNTYLTTAGEYEEMPAE